MHYMQQRPSQSINVVKLTLAETGTYNPQFSRPYQSYVDGETLNAIENRIDATGAGAITGHIIAGVASKMLQPSATPVGLIDIPYGWSERRIRFILEVQVTASTGTTCIYYFQGYTSHLGVSYNGAVDPNMEFIINSFIRVNRASVLTSFGMQSKDIVTESAHVLNGCIQSQQQPIYAIRPQDVFTGIQSNYITNAVKMYSNNSQNVFDTRINVSNEPLRSGRANNLPATYIASVVDSYKTATSLGDFGQGNSDILSRCLETTYEASINENPFIRTLSQVKGIPNAVTFNMNDLIRIDPNAPKVTNYITLGKTVTTQLHQAGQTAYWDSVNRETVVATVLSNSVPAIMMDLLIRKIHIRSTNHDIGGVMNTVIIDAQTVTNADLSQHFELFKRRLEKEILFDITYGNQDLYMLEMSVDLFGETVVNLSIGNSPMTMYSTPSFCDGLLAPVITPSKDNYTALIHDFDVLTNNIKQATTSSAVFNTMV